MLSRGDIVLDPSRHVVTRSGRFVSLTKKEFAVLEVTLSNLRRKLGNPPAIETVVGMGYMTSAARRLSEQNLHERLALQGPDDELKELGRHLRRHARAAREGLRQPAPVRGRRLPRAAHAPVDHQGPDRRGPGRPWHLRCRAASHGRDATERSERLVDSLLVLARSDRGRTTSEAVPLDEVLAEVRAQSAAEAIEVEAPWP